MNATQTITTARELADGLRTGTIEAVAADTELTLGALADPGGPECYPETTIEFRRGEEVVAAVGCWVLGQYMRGPNRRDNGAWIGQGWVWQVDEGDGACSGRPRYDHRQVKEGEAVTFAGDNTAPDLVLTLADDENDADDAETIQAAIDDAYDSITASPAADEDVAEALRNRKPVDEIEAAIEFGNDETDRLSLALFAGIDAGRPVYTYAGSDEVWEDAEDCVAAAVAHLAEALEGAASAVRDDDRSDTIRRMERRTSQED
jgi:hypothetical protein